MTGGVGPVAHLRVPDAPTAARARDFSVRVAGFLDEKWTSAETSQAHDLVIVRLTWLSHECGAPASFWGAGV